MTIKEYIINYAKDRYYFHINDLREYFAEKGTEFKKDSLKKYQQKWGQVLQYNIYLIYKFCE